MLRKAARPSVTLSPAQKFGSNFSFCDWLTRATASREPRVSVESVRIELIDFSTVINVIKLIFTLEIWKAKIPPKIWSQIPLLKLSKYLAMSAFLCV